MDKVCSNPRSNKGNNFFNAKRKISIHECNFLIKTVLSYIVSIVIYFLFSKLLICFIKILTLDLPFDSGKIHHFLIWFP